MKPAGPSPPPSHPLLRCASFLQRAHLLPGVPGAEPRPPQPVPHVPHGALPRPAQPLGALRTTSHTFCCCRITHPPPGTVRTAITSTEGKRQHTPLFCRRPWRVRLCTTGNRGAEKHPGKSLPCGVQEAPRGGGVGPRRGVAQRNASAVRHGCGPAEAEPLPQHLRAQASWVSIQIRASSRSLPHASPRGFAAE